MRTAPYSTRKDLARMLGNIEHMVQELASEEVNMRRARKQQTPVQQQWLAQIDEAIGDFQHWALLAHLSGT